VTAPDYVEPFTGWRVWRVVETPAGLQLCSVLYEDAWRPGRAFEARCARGHAAPDLECGCGIHATRSADRASRYLLGREDGMVVLRVLGVVALWGVVLEGPGGWRSSHAYPVRLVVPELSCAEDVAWRLRRYRVPIEIVHGRRPFELAELAAA
jgi:hypothetical protein